MLAGIAQHLSRLCDALYACAYCGSTIFGKDLHVAAYEADNITGLVKFDCRCGGVLEPIEVER
jgi:hypothetical protein